MFFYFVVGLNIYFCFVLSIRYIFIVASLYLFCLLLVCIKEYHRRRIETEGKAKVVASVWGQNFFNSLPR